jgi:hypothetical protein
MKDRTLGNWKKLTVSKMNHVIKISKKLDSIGITSSAYALPLILYPIDMTVNGAMVTRLPSEQDPFDF